jgi:hypothetical protein
MVDSIEVLCLIKLFKKLKYTKNKYSESQINTIYLKLINNLLLNKINVLVTDTSRLEEVGICLINLSTSNDELYFMLCKFNYKSDCFEFYDFKNNMSFYSSKEVINSLSNTKCLLTI